MYAHSLEDVVRNDSEVRRTTKLMHGCRMNIRNIVQNTARSLFYEVAGVYCSAKNNTFIVALFAHL